MNLLQYYFCFMFWFFGHEPCGILAPQPGMEPSPLALEGKVLTTELPEQFLDYSCHPLLCKTSFSWALGLSSSFQLHRDPSSKLCSWDFLTLFYPSILRQFSFHPLHCPDPLYFDLTPSRFSLVWVVVLQSSEAHKLFQFLQNV